MRILLFCLFILLMLFMKARENRLKKRIAKFRNLWHLERIKTTELQKKLDLLKGAGYGK